MSDSIVVPLLSLGGSVFVAYVTARLTYRSKRAEAIASFKEAKYATLLVALQGFVGRTASADLKRKFFEEQYQSWLYASDSVISALNALVALVVEGQGVAPDPEIGRRAMGNIVLEMRRDLLGRTALDFSAFQYTDVHPDRK